MCLPYRPPPPLSRVIREKSAFPPCTHNTHESENEMRVSDEARSEARSEARHDDVEDPCISGPTRDSTLALAEELLFTLAALRR